MASVARRPNGKWRARYRDMAGKEHSRHFRRKVDAETWLKQVTASIVRGDYVDPNRSKMTVREMAQTWASTPRWAQTTRARNESILKNYVLPKWGTHRLRDVQFEEAQEWVNELAAGGLSAGTVHKVFWVLSGVLNLAVTAKRLPENPLKDVELPKQTRVRRRYLNAMQVEALAEAADEYGDIVLVLAYCGLRIGELAALRVRDVNMLRKRLTVHESVTEVDGKLVWSAPKDEEPRQVPFPDFLEADIADRCEGKAPQDVLFTTGRGAVIRVRNMRRDWFDVAATAAGIEGLTPHELRHTAASLSVSSGASVLALQRMLGHDKPSTTLDVYSDLFDEDLDVLAERLTSVRTKGRADYLRTTTRAAPIALKSASR